jgi:transcription initiation factor TFIIE subunit alpha
MVMPKIDVLDWIKRHPTITTTVDGEPVQDDGLAIAGSKPGVTQKQVYEVVLTADDKEERERRRARELEASKRKEQNALPSWHTHSTVSGAVTSFGLHNATKPVGAGPVTVVSQPELENDQKNGIAEWYAKLDAEASQTSEASGETPMDIESLYASRLSVPPRLQNSYSSSSLKRKLVIEDGDVSMRSHKHSRSTSYQSSPASDTMVVRSRDSVPSSSHTSPTSSTAGWTASQQSTGAAGGGDPKDPVVYVDGVAMVYSRVTEEHHDSMTPEEYQRYMDLYLLLGESG